MLNTCISIFGVNMKITNLRLHQRLNELIKSCHFSRGRGAWTVRCRTWAGGPWTSRRNSYSGGHSRTTTAANRGPWLQQSPRQPDQTACWSTDVVGLSANQTVSYYGIVSEMVSLWPSDAIWRHRSGSTLAQVMACCLTAPSHYLNQYWLIIRKV